MDKKVDSAPVKASSGPEQGVGWVPIPAWGAQIGLSELWPRDAGTQP